MRLRRILLTCGLSLFVMAGCSDDAVSPTGTASRPVTAKFSVSVDDFFLYGILNAPFSVEKGDLVELSLSFHPESDDESLGETICTYYGFHNAWLTVRAAEQYWMVPIDQIGLQENGANDAMYVSGSTLTHSRFAGHLGRSAIAISLTDREAPYDLLNGMELQGIDLAEADHGFVNINSWGDDGRRWAIRCSFRPDLGSTQ